MAEAEDSNAVEVLNMLSSVLWRAQRLTESAAVIARLIELQPGNAMALNALGLCLLGQAKADEAEAALLKAIQLAPGYALIHHNLGLAIQAQNRMDEAILTFRRAIDLDPELFPSLSNLAQLLLAKGDPGAGDMLRRAFEASPDSVPGKLEKARSILVSDGNLEEAESCVRSALKVVPKDGPALTLLAMIRQRMGRFDEAETDLRQSIEAAPNEIGSYWMLFYGKKVTEEDRNLVSSLEAQLAQKNRVDHDRRVGCFALGKAYNDLRQFELAMDRYHEANRLCRKIDGKSFDRKAYIRETDAIIDTFSWERLDSQRNLGSKTDVPVFIVGMFRSGTTLVEQILSSHSNVSAGGEIGFWPANARKCYLPKGRIDAVTSIRLANSYLDLIRRKQSAGITRVTDKFPENYRHAGLLHLLYPNARIISCKRHPVDNCLSLYFTYFTSPPPFAYDPDDLVLGYREHVRLIDHWRTFIPSNRLLEVRYEDLVADPETIARRIVKFCDLPWEEQCLRPEKNERAVTTASLWQVRQPIYKSAVERWRNYEPFLGPFRTLLNAV